MHNIIHQCLIGELEVLKEGEKSRSRPFLMLGLDMPPQPLFKKEVMLKKKNRTINLPQVSLFDILKKFDGETSQKLRVLVVWQG